MAGVTTVAIGVVFVLLLGEIDLSIGYVSGIAGVVVAEMQLPNGRFEVKYGLVAIIVAVDRDGVDRRVPGIDGSPTSACRRSSSRWPATCSGRA